MESFEEIEGAVLEGISTSEATYVDVGDRIEPLKRTVLLKFGGFRPTWSILRTASDLSPDFEAESLPSR